jgi:hypothetical protein
VRTASNVSAQRQQRVLSRRREARPNASACKDTRTGESLSATKGGCGVKRRISTLARWVSPSPGLPTRGRKTPVFPFPGPRPNGVSAAGEPLGPASDQDSYASS